MDEVIVRCATSIIIKTVVTNTFPVVISRFHKKLSNIRSYLKNPVPHGSENRVWCVFCNCDIEELPSFFAFGTAIHHLASASHLKNTKSFLWKHGGKMDKVDSLRILEADVVKVFPMILFIVLDILIFSSIFYIHDLQLFQCMLSCYDVHLDGEAVNREIVNQGLNNLTKISIPLQQQDGQGNVHSGAPPPWFDHLNVGLKSESRSSGSLSKQGGKSKLNPNRVGAAWAEQRKIEMEMEKKGEIVFRDVDPNWLPNFGSVWQSGTRKKSRKEFESEKKKKSTNYKVGDSESEASIKIQPYVGKRMKKDRDK
ncbi:TITAN-like protein [Impatiens glandulifera]|uniref:TITAN-like protein n=1 Tax=Impatiens glandulifera TaxID=253017 RepID=UPI001FB13FD6|nr:TITAN-like protein [Impatiens glandulifera]